MAFKNQDTEETEIVMNSLHHKELPVRLANVSSSRVLPTAWCPHRFPQCDGSVSRKSAISASSLGQINSPALFFFVFFFSSFFAKLICVVPPNPNQYLPRAAKMNSPHIRGPLRLRKCIGVRTFSCKLAEKAFLADSESLCVTLAASFVC